MLTVLEQPSGRLVDLNASMTLEEYLALPDDTRIEIVEGVLRPMARSITEGRRVQRRLTNLIEASCPREYEVEFEEIVVLEEEPPEARIPDVTVFAAAGKIGDTNHVAVEYVLLVVEVVSPGSETENRRVKPETYARHGIPHYWRVELKPEIAVHTYVLTDGG